ncbi:hypothetical protein TSOC_008517 [Tetrabaena socialis]|uniref:phytol kinase n=1 Tax=Tetrabaena socialis TaxID=47790 RepID=A0A2J7ZYA1_9CHLO|nr:hypothetical protein TSOC_008517 [Tetrabaena socialis]|eukprot:PNH05240.1 hypothetical protein TSOC_008517 [Tetrabaena socialis]
MVAAAVRRPLTAPSSSNRSEGSGSSGSPSRGSSRNGGGNGCGAGGNQGSMGRGDSTPEATALLAQKACDTTRVLLHLLSMQPPPSAAAPDFVRKLLRTQTLQCLARRFAEAAAAAGALTAQQLELTESYAETLCITIHMLTKLSAESGPDQLPLVRFARQLPEALLDSSVVEHLARLLLLLLQQRAPTCSVDTTQRMARCIFVVCQNIAALHQHLTKDGDEAACAALRQVLWGRCIRHVVLVHGVAALCGADGGPTYGLPDAVRQAAFSSCMVGAGHGQPERPLQLEPVLMYALQAVFLDHDVPLTPAVATRVAFSVLLRFGRLVVASAGGECAAQQAGLRSLDWLGTHVLLDAVQPLLFGGPLPSAVPPVTAAALAGGVLPCLEHLLRRAGEEPSGPESDVVKAMLRRQRAWQLWCLLLAYGEQRQAAALVATVGKLLRRVGTGAVAEWASSLTGCAGSVLSRALETPAAPEQVQALPEQLARMLMYAVCEWLPELSRIALQLMAAPVVLGSADEPAWACSVLAPLLTWLPLLLLRCDGGGGDGATVATTTAGAADAAGPGSCAADDLRLLLLEEVRAVPLLGGALRRAQHSTTSSALRLSLAESCCLVAATWPDELLRALVPHLRKEGAEQVTDGVLALAQLLEVRAAAAGSGGGGGSNSGGCDSQEAQVRERLLTVVTQMHDTAAGRDRLLAANLSRALLRICSYCGCTRLAGDSEAEARLQACGRCGAAWYCCRECQLLHWREGGHKAACADGSKPRSS